jgi:DNA-binding transcriptional regulator PaaX
MGDTINWGIFKRHFWGELLRHQQGAKLMVLTLGDLDLLKQLRGAGVSGRNVRELNIRVTLDRLVKGGYLVGRPIGRDSVQYRITQRGQDAIVEHDL